MYSGKNLYSKEHEWLSVDGDTALIGITHHAQDQLGDIVYVDLPDVDSEFEIGEEFGSVESVKAVAEVFMPIGGTIVEVNEDLEDSPEAVNKDPHGKGWLIKIKIADQSELEKLLSAEAYEAFVKEESK
ncbi:glycine cleavage system protein GcvH [Sulfidibacter corallicola]|uniref:Glycine cleavage system H protein n=1 Tax=Sulfidibacter corallicola TaxID=2818388 RepID=A0A8A4TVE3_SULCO|nr:glycine cleavage system protein GcvH [Sulfidibacter corallicola]QTD53101.1 glycine cleavage system protein GcvH [Sulfidibacter corallicola]